MLRDLERKSRATPSPTPAWTLPSSLSPSTRPPSHSRRDGLARYLEKNPSTGRGSADSHSSTAPSLAEPARPTPPPPPPPSAHYTFSLRGTQFYLSATLLRTDSPNLFTRTLLAPPSSQRISPRSEPFELDGDPRIFEIILNFFGGYEIFPLNESQFLTSDRRAITRNLLKDAKTYELRELQKLAEEELKSLETGSAQLYGSERRVPALGEGELQTRQGCSVFSAM